MKTEQSPTVNKSDFPPEKDWPKPGWYHALNYHKFIAGDVFAWYEGEHLFTGLVEESKACAVKVKNILPGVMQP